MPKRPPEVAGEQPGLRLVPGALALLCCALVGSDHKELSEKAAKMLKRESVPKGLGRWLGAQMLRS